MLSKFKSAFFLASQIGLGLSSKAMTQANVWRAKNMRENLLGSKKCNRREGCGSKHILRTLKATNSYEMSSSQYPCNHKQYAVKSPAYL